MRAQRADPSDTPTAEGLLKDDFGEYTIRTEKFNDANDWYCRHHYVRDGGVYGYHYAHLNGLYYSKNPDGSSESVNPILKEASYTLPGNKIPIDYSDEVDWERLNEIPDPCVARASVTHKLLGEFLQKLKNQEEKIVAIDQAKKRATWKRRLKGKESPDMITEDEAEETECETEETSDEEDASQQMLSEQRKREKENGTEENEEERCANHMHEDIESIDQPMDAVETEGISSQKRKADEMDGSEEETARTPAAKKGNMNKRRESTLTEREKKNAANRRKRERRRKANQAKQGMEKRTT
ncbi:Dimeric alpha-beta barrel [Penicillium robsamsonii]|uniref:Dimeric alpha-beta barrel n=1 Tax=Penicillium robsamsonii TaxID=1792511 RepID=UPI00254922EA|nr:Dimeric alpha-beta barrel [Penicillium robsamsonii]KAJ5827457.1 Dimeric alpha-beta barrel [Penicillium robsamsonii]